MKKLIDYCYHTHTYRCGHAIGSDEDYVLAAIAKKMKVLGFSDHVFLPGVFQDGIRGKFSELEGYVSSIRTLQNKYKKKIKIYLGFEAEYDPMFDEYYHQLLKSKTIDYLLIGQHCDFVNNVPHWYLSDTPNTKRLTKYVSDLIKGMSTGLFSYVCHPDMYMSSYPKFDDFAKDLAIKICLASIQYDVPLEINLGGVRHYGQHISGQEVYFGYPYEDFWKVVGEIGCKVVIGVDAHNPKDFEISNYIYAMQIVEKYSLNLLSRIEFKKI
jgi:histidinol-phosphatase (PHP family)